MNAHYHILAMAAHISAAADKPELSAAYLERLRAIRPDYDYDTYARAFPLFREEDIRLVRKVFSRR